MLHIIRHSGFNSNALTLCLDTALAGDAILLMDDGCYNLTHPSLLAKCGKQTELKVYFVDLHAKARAIHTNQAAVSAIDMSAVITLIFQHENSITWS
ncbi:tRNA 2-thiouridine synthesizing protein B [Colwellia chukchiensis]|uniref:tRNA 2-thiouridine synthesizing protein B n=1 Tax=Colwellia chukchiensis TaxID=641665 RepID=A0A1H7ML75_9GAMM|nr:sulfurtransferase complex subunit TusB [Colwellia chukchiensis]SEL12046.1 tRNA 2-thiouridine synthesizing protein B [Colwellia chukchiensis]